MKSAKRVSFLLIFCLLLGLSPAARAEGGTLATVIVESPEETQSVIIVDGEEAATASREEEMSPAVYPIHVEAGQIYYAAYEDTVYNNGGVVYNSGGLVYNNNGLVYNNDGVTYNNGGTVYANGGEVFSGVGQVIPNGGAVYDYSTVFRDPARFRVTLVEDPAPFAELSGLTEENGVLWLEEGAACTVTPRDGYHLFSAESSGGELRTNEEGALILEKAGELRLSLRFQPDPPVFDKASGTYGQVEMLELSAAPGAEIYYWLSGEAGDLEEAELYTAPILLEKGCSITAVAMAEGAETSESATAAYAILRTSVPLFPEQKAGEEAGEAQSLLLENLGTEDARLESIYLDGRDAACFLLQGPETLTIPAGERDESSYTLAAAEGLAAGEYTATVVLSFDSGSSVSLPIFLTVAE